MDGSIGTVGDAYNNGLMESTIGGCTSLSSLMSRPGRGRTGVRWNAPQPDGSAGIITSGCIPRSGISRRPSTTPTTNEKTTQAVTPRNTPLSKTQADSYPLHPKSGLHQTVCGLLAPPIGRGGSTFLACRWFLTRFRGVHGSSVS